MILSLDPGQKPGIVILAPNGAVVAATHRLDVAVGWATGALTYTLAVSEEQWLFEDSKATPKTLFSLARRAGFQLAQFPADRYMFLPPSVWRGTNATKEQVQARIARDLTPAERALFRDIPKGRHGDVLDAIGIGRSGIQHALKGRAYDFVLHV